MKNLLYILIIFAIGSCGRHEEIPGCPGWISSGNAEFDSLTALVIKSHKSPNDTSAIYIAKMAKLAASDTTNGIMQARVDMFRFSLDQQENDNAYKISLLQHAFSKTDSTRFARDYNIILWYYGTILHNMEQGLKSLEQARHYFSKSGDLHNEAGVFTSLCNRYRLLGQINESHYYALCTDSVADLIGDSVMRRLNIVNIALTSSPEDGAKLLRSVLADSICNANIYVKESIRRDLFLLTDSIHYLDSAETLADKYAFLQEYKLVYKQLRAQYNDRHGNPYEALKLGREALYMLTDSTPTRFLEQGCSILSNIYRSLGNADSALKYSDWSIFFRDSLNRETRRDEALALKFTQQMERQQMNTRIEVEHERMIWITIVSVLLLAILMTAFLIHRKQSRRRLRQLQREAEIKQERYRMAALLASFEEKDRLITDIRQIIKTNAEMPTDMTKKLNSTLRLHDSTEVERESFIQIHDKLSPDFSKRLKAAYPDISESQLRMAAYIASGMTNRQIARVQSISYDSVKKTRYRLRSRLGLTTEQSLEEALRRFTD